VACDRAGRPGLRSRSSLETLLTTWLFLIGLAIGSFLNVVIARVPLGQSVVRPRSRCPRCGHQLAWYENVPVVSWLALRGRCSSCRAPISPRYLVVELLTGLLYVACVARLGWDWPLVGALTFVTVLLPLVFIDAEHWVLPFELLWPGIGLGLALRAPLGLESVEVGLWGAGAGYLAFRAMELLGWLAMGQEALGAGDKYLLAMVGATLGWRPLLGVVLLSALQGAVYGVAMLRLTGRAGPGHPASTGAKAAGGSADDLPAPREGRERWTPAFLRPGLPWWQRALLVPYALLVQDIPDPPPLDETGQEPEWIPQANNLPFGPWIGLAALEVLLAGPALQALAQSTPFGLTAQVLFGGA
jgi:leader peptidase (prepilin peptidase) / N-methyltransferase